MSPSQPSGFYVPTIDIAPALADPSISSPATQAIIADIRAACVSTGFFQITGHGIPRRLQQAVFDAAARFFQLGLPDKQKLDCKTTVGYRGYDVLASQSYEEGVMPDLKEGFYVGTDVPKSDPLYGRFFSGPNVWPPADLLAPSDFRDPCQDYYAAIHSLTIKVLELVGASMTLPLGAANGHKANGNHTQQTNGINGHDTVSAAVPPVIHKLAHASPIPACPLRLLHYPSAKHNAANTDMPQFGASAHTDFGAITLLLQDDNPGLEVLDTAANLWRPIDPNPDAYVVNIGDMVSMVTKDAYKSSVHRVVCKRPDRDRYSVVFFFDGCLDVDLEQVDSFKVDGTGDVGQQRPLTVEQHMIERLTMSYGKGKKDQRRAEESG